MVEVQAWAGVGAAIPPEGGGRRAHGRRHLPAEALRWAAFHDWALGSCLTGSCLAVMPVCNDKRPVASTPSASTSTVTGQ